MKKTTKILVMGVILIMSLGIFSACNSGLWFNVGYEERLSFGEKEDSQVSEYSLLTVINSTDELKALCDERNNPAFLEERQGYSANLSRLIRSYDEAYFSEKALIVCLLLSSNGGISYTVRAVKNEEKILQVNIKKKESKGDSTMAIDYWTFLIEVKKADIADVTEINLKFN